MFIIVKDKERIQVSNRQALSVYMANGWKLQKKVTEEVVEQVAKPTESLMELTKKQLQAKLAKQDIAYKPQENKSDLIAKLKNSNPADDFNDGLLKG